MDANKRSKSGHISAPKRFPKIRIWQNTNNSVSEGFPLTQKSSEDIKFISWERSGGSPKGGYIPLYTYIRHHTALYSPHGFAS